MKQHFTRYLGFVLATLAAALLIPAFIAAQNFPTIPHPLDGRDDCLACHETGVGRAAKIPDDHTGRTNDLCRDCHLTETEATPAAEAPSPLPAIPHPLTGRDDCLVCHEAGVVGATKIPGDHAGRTNDICQGCHRPAADVPFIPHPLEGRDECLACHETGVAGAAQPPASHAGRTNDLCQSCHQKAIEPTPVSEAPAAVEAPSPVPVIPHPLKGRESCLGCHGTGIEGITQTPPDHIGRTNDLCQNCHRPAATISVAGAPGFPPIPHLLEGRDTCLACHETGSAGATKIPDDHAGRTNDICQGCHQPAAGVTPGAESSLVPSIPHSLEGRDTCLACHETGMGGATKTPASHAGRTNDLCQGCHQPEAPAGAPAIPHQLNGREKCLTCHQEGAGGAPRYPEDHAGRTNDLCQGCHQPGQNPEVIAQALPVPTPITQYPWSKDINTCFGCHSTLEDEGAKEIPDQWARSIHSERNVGCVDCHGGDPTASTLEGAMSPEANYIGVPAKADIPALCASCHADVARMRQYDLPTDQYFKYQESTHGSRLAQGDLNVPTCFDCHGEHQVLKANDPASTVYPSNVPTLCASCHSDATLMAAYNIPSNQFDLYQESVHGHALLDNQDFRAPNCATCHGTHGATPPGFEEVANICGSCHSATQDYYLQSPHANAGFGAPKCITCHGRYDVSKPSEDLFVGTAKRHCNTCHTPDSTSGQVVQTLYDSLTAAAQAGEEAEASVVSARKRGMLVTQLEGQLREANTSLIIARAAQHTLDSEGVHELTDDVQTIANQVKADAETAIAESAFRRRALVPAVAAISLIVVALYTLKRELDRQQEDEA